MQALILAAGRGSRLKNLTREQPKALLPFRGEPLLCRNLRLLAERPEINEIVLVVGYQATVIQALIGDRVGSVPVRYVHNPDWSTTNNIHSFWLARDALHEDFLLLECDLVFDEELLRRAIEDEPEHNAILADHLRPWMEGTVIEFFDGRMEMVNNVRQKAGLDPAHAYKTVNIYRFRADFFRGALLGNLELYLKHMGPNAYYETVLGALLYWGYPDLRLVCVEGCRWYEIDDQMDLAQAEYLFAEPVERYAHLTSSHGGYWKHEMLDFSYLYNPYYPGPDYYEALAKRLPDLVGSYPSCLREINDLVAAWLGVDSRFVTAANGSAELIRLLMHRRCRQVTVPVPTFNEYLRTAAGTQCDSLPLTPPKYQIDVAQLVAHVRAVGSDTLVVVNPCNPTGQLLSLEEMHFLLSNLADLRQVIVDESFMDFSDVTASLQPEFAHYHNLVVLKSISKSYGVAGLRLGYALSADESLIASLRSAMPIWNINSLAEDFLEYQIKHDDAFQIACAHVRKDRKMLRRALRSIPGLRVQASSANFLFCELPADHRSDEVALRLFTRHGILVKDCSGKPGLGSRHLRIAVRTPSENKRLVEALGDVLDSPDLGHQTTG